MEQDVNEVRLEAMREQFYTALEAQDWGVCRSLLTDIEYMKGTTYEMRRDMNAAMSKEEKKEYVSYIPTSSESIDRHISSSSEGYGGSY